MKKIFRKNQIIITALVIMVAVAGYLSLANDEDSLVSVSDTLSSSVSEEGNVNVSEADITSAEEGQDEVVVSGAAATADNQDGVVDTKKQAASTEPTSKETGKKNAGEAVMVGSTVAKDYFEEAKLSREQTRAKNKETLLQLVNNANATEAAKEKAMNEIVNMTAIQEKETAAENLLSAKGFQDVVVSIAGGSVDVIVNSENVTEAQIAQIQDIVKRKTEVASDKIVISPVGKKK